MSVLRQRERTETILVVCTRQIGDVLLTTPLIRAAKARWPEASIDVIGFEGTLGMLRGNPDVREAIEVSSDRRIATAWRLVRRLWRRYDLALIAQYSDRAHLYGFVAARRRSGQVFAGAKSWWKRALLDHAVLITDEHEHSVVEKLRLLEPWGLPQAAALRPPPGLPLPLAVEQALQAPYVVVHVPSLVRYKQWPVEHFAALAALLSERGLQVVLSGSAAEIDRLACARVAELANKCPVLDVSGCLDLNQLVTLLRGAAAYVGPDASITHLAAACDVPTVALFGPISPRLWGPWPSDAGATASPYVDRAMRQQASSVVVLQGPPACVPCNRSGCENHVASRSECLETLAPQRVAAEVMLFVERVPSRPLGDAVDNVGPAGQG